MGHPYRTRHETPKTTTNPPAAPKKAASAKTPTKDTRKP